MSELVMLKLAINKDNNISDAKKLCCYGYNTVFSILYYNFS